MYTLTLDQNAFQALPVEVQNLLLAGLRGAQPNTVAVVPPVSGTAAVATDDLEPPDLSPAQAAEFLERCGEKTKRAIRTMVQGDAPYFQVADIAKALGTEARYLAGTWAAITKVTKRILGAPVQLIGWGEGINDENAVYVDQRGWLSEMTYRSFRRALHLDNPERGAQQNVEATGSVQNVRLLPRRDPTRPDEGSPPPEEAPVRQPGSARH